MHVTDIQTLCRFNAWANHRIIDVVKSVPVDDYRRDLGSSYGGIHGTMVHIMSAEEIWLKRWNSERMTSLHNPDEFTGLDELVKYWTIVESLITAFSEALTDEKEINRVIHYRDLKGNEYSQQLDQLIQHLVNHSSYHRGQVVTMLRQLNIKPVGTDMINYFRQLNLQPR